MVIHIPPQETYSLSAKMVGKQRWYTTPNGNLYPSITTVLGIVEKPEIVEWRKALGVKKADKETKRAADRGTALHNLVERILLNDEDVLEEQTLETIKLYNQIKHHLKRINNVHLLEGTLFSDLLEVAGRVDCIAEYDGVLSIIDFKTSTNNKTTQMVDDYFLQETFYALAYTELHGKSVNQIVTIMAVENGIAPLVWKKTIFPYVKPLQTRIEYFYQNF